MIPLIIIIISLLLDGILTNYLPYLVGNLSLFTPLLTLVSIIMIYPFYKKKLKKYYITVLITGIIYDLLYTNLLFINSIIFIIIAYINVLINKRYKINFLSLIIYITFIIVIYESLYAILLIIFKLIPITINKLLYKITHSILINIIYAEVEYIVVKYFLKRNKISIN